jgi:hypothetical protein
MDSGLKKILRAVSLELRHVLEGRYDDQGRWLAGDLERRLNELGVWRDRPAKPLAELSHLSAEDTTARHVVDGYLRLREEAGVARNEAVAEFVREAAYTWANRLFALRCMEARGIIDEVILQKETYGGRSMVHSRFARRNPEACAGEDDGLFAVLFTEFTERATELSVLFNPHAPAVALRPSVTALKRCIALLSGREAVRGQEPASDAVFEAPDAFGWAYQYWNAEEKDRVFEMVRTKKGAKIEGADIIPATCIYTEPYMVKFLVQNSLGALWMGMHPESKLYEKWEYYVKNADGAPMEKKPVAALTFLDPACGSGHFLLEAFDLLYSMYEEEGNLREPSEISAAILNNNLFGIDIDERALQIAEAVLWMKAKEKAPDLDPTTLDSFRDHLVATNIRLPKGKDHLQAFLKKHPEDQPLHSALEAVFQGLENVHELGSLLQIEEPVEKELRYLKAKSEENKGKLEQQALFGELAQPKQGELPLGVESYEQWKARTLAHMRDHFGDEAEAADPVQAFFGQSAEKGLALFDFLSRRYDIVAANPPYMGSGNMGSIVREYVEHHYTPGKRDLYAAFILRCRCLARVDGYVAMVTQRSFLNNKYLVDLRSELIDKSSMQVCGDLGVRAFSEVSGEKVSVAMHVYTMRAPEETQTIFLDLRAVFGPDEKASRLVSHSCQQWNHPWTVFRALPDCRIMYSASTKTLRLFEGATPWDDDDRVTSFAYARRGLDTCEVDRWTRFWWEVGEQPGWVTYIRGPHGHRWEGGFLQVVRWGSNGEAIKGGGKAIIPNEDLYFRPCATFSRIGSRGLVARRNASALISDSGSGVFSSKLSPEAICALLNSRVVAHLLRLVNPSYNFQTGDINILPRPRAEGNYIQKLEESANAPPSALYTSQEPSPGLNRLLHCMLTYLREEPRDEPMD